MKYEAPETIDQAIDIYSKFNGSKKILAGGTDVLVQLRTDIVRPEMVMNIKKINSLHEFCIVDGYWKIGAAVSASKITKNTAFISEWPGIAEGVGLIGSTQIQNRATLVGNLSNASPAADGIPALVAANAKVEIVGQQGSRVKDVYSLIEGPGKLHLSKDEFITHILIPLQRDRSADCYLRFIPRTEMDIAVVGCGVNLSVKNQSISSAKIVLGAVGPKVIFADEAAELVLNSRLDKDVILKLQRMCEEIATPISDKRGSIRFRRQVAGVLAKRALQKAYARALEVS